MSLISSYILPHPPIIIPQIGKGEENKALATINAYLEVTQDIEKRQPDTIVVITPHGPTFEDAICISTENILSGNFEEFNAPNLKFEFNNNMDLVNKIIENCNNENILVGQVDNQFARQYRITTRLDHGTLVPLYFVNQKHKDYKLVHISMGFLPYHELYNFGICIKNAIEQTNEKISVIASADLSHKLPNSSYGHSPFGKLFDSILTSHIEEHNVESILEMDNRIVEEAAQCGLRPIIILQGVMDGFKVKPFVLSYEGPFGIGYSVVEYNILGSGIASLYPKIICNMYSNLEKLRSKEDQYIRLARMALEEYILNGKIISVPNNITEELLNQRAGVFVSIKKYNKLRGCIGTISPTRKNIAEEIIHNSISAGTNDSRFFPIGERELDQLVYSVDVLKEPEKIFSKEQLDVEKYGVIVRNKNKSGLLLPNLEGIDTVDEQIDIALQKAGISRDEKYWLERFEVVRHDTK